MENCKSSDKKEKQIKHLLSRRDSVDKMKISSLINTSLREANKQKLYPRSEMSSKDTGAYVHSSVSNPSKSPAQVLNAT